MQSYLHMKLEILVICSLIYNQIQKREARKTQKWCIGLPYRTVFFKCFMYLGIHEKTPCQKKISYKDVHAHIYTWIYVHQYTYMQACICIHIYVYTYCNEWVTLAWNVKDLSVSEQNYTTISRTGKDFSIWFVTTLWFPWL